MSSAQLGDSTEGKPTPLWRKWGLGLVVVAAIAAAVSFAFLHCASSRLLILTCLSDAQGLREGAEVRFAGVQVGFVRSVRARPDDKQCPADVEMAISPGYPIRIPQDSIVVAETAGVLGPTLLEINAREASGPPVENRGFAPQPHGPYRPMSLQRTYGPRRGKRQNHKEALKDVGSASRPVYLFITQGCPLVSYSFRSIGLQ